MKKKAVSMLLAGVMVVSMLAGCGKGGSSEPEKTADGKTKLKALFVSHSADPGCRRHGNGFRN